MAVPGPNGAVELPMLCLWTAIPQTLRSFRARLESVLERIAHNSVIRSLKRVDQGEGLTRYDALLVSQLPAPSMCKALRASRSIRCHVIQHRPYEHPSRENVRAQRHDLTRTVPVPFTKLTLMSLNINGLKHKTQELHALIHSERPAALCLQETHRLDPYWSLTVHQNYRTLECAVEESKYGSHGLALAVRKDLVVKPVGDPSPFWLFGKISAAGLDSPFIMGTVYMPHKGKAKTILALGRVVKQLMHRFPTLPIVIGGDWNCSSQDLAKKMSKKRWPACCIVPFSGADLTYHDAQAHGVSGIDHFVTLRADGRHGTARVRRQWDLSDHWPVRLRYLCAGKLDEKEDVTPTSCRPRIRLTAGQVPDLAATFRTHNSFDALADLPDSAEIQTVAQGFVDACHEAASAVGIEGKAPKPRNKLTTVTIRPPLDVRKAIRERSERYQDMRRKRPGSQERSDALAEYSQKKDKAKKLVKAWKQRQWSQRVLKGTGLFARLHPRKYWAWCKKLMKQHFSREPVSDEMQASAVKDPASGSLITDAETIGKLWAKHYGDLATDVTGHSRTTDHWEEMMEEEELHTHSPLPGLNDPISWAEVVLTLRSMKTNKAPGEDGVPLEVLRCAIDESADEDDEPVAPMSKVLHGLVTWMWHEGTVPEVWQTAVVVSIPKKGDMADMNNYRGISLIGAALKLVSTIVARRLNKALEDSGRLVREQAGFRSYEECMGQSVALYEALMRRKKEGHVSYVVFIDLRKAFDTVPHEAMLMKLRNIGVTGKALAFIRTLYKVSAIRVKGKFGMSPAAPYLRGVRQGCPLSPILFDVFINDVLKEVVDQGLGVKVLGGPGQTHSIPGLMFADDLGVLTPTRKGLKRVLKLMTTWADRWEMSIGQSKCGIMVCGPEEKRVLRKAKLRGGKWELQGEPIPIVSEYTYLGNLFTEKLDLEVMARTRTEGAQKVYRTIQHFLACRTIPVDTRAMVLQSMVLSSAAYGAELWGMNEARADAGERLRKKGLRVLFGARETSPMVAIEAASAELGIAHFAAYTAARRARALVKFSALKTWVSSLIGANGAGPLNAWGRGNNVAVPRGMTKSWVRQTVRWIGTWGDKTSLTMVGEETTVEAMDAVAKRVAKANAEAVTARKRRIDKTKSWARYARWELQSTNDYLRGWAMHPELSMGWQALMRMRTGSFVTGSRLAKMGGLPAWAARACPVCRRREQPETLRHLLLHCPQWSVERARFLGTVLNAMYGREGLALRTLFGERGAVESAQVQVGLPWASAVGTESAEAEESARGMDSVSLRVARFFQAILPIREARLPRPQRANAANRGRAALRHLIHVGNRDDGA